MGRHGGEVVHLVGEAQGDPVWALPLWSPYDEDLASRIADVNNAGSSGFAGAITALGTEADELFSLLEPWGVALRAAGAYLSGGADDLARKASAS